MNAERKEAKRERILDAAVVEIAGRGYYRTTVSDIAGRAGVADGTIYLYFKGKEDILVSIFERAMQRFADEARWIVEEGAGDPEQTLRRIVALHLTLLGEDRDLAVIFQVEFRHTLHVLELFSRSRIRDYLALIAQVVEDRRGRAVRRQGGVRHLGRDGHRLGALAEEHPAGLPLRFGERPSVGWVARDVNPA
jgi:TetR/AcrR family fatty acid metabolism transcriptional regulator